MAHPIPARDADRGGRPDAQRQEATGQQSHTNRYALGHLDPVAGRVLRRQQRNLPAPPDRLCTTPRFMVLYMSTTIRLLPFRIRRLGLLKFASTGIPYRRSR
jgi:hypothetical protein